MKRILIVLTLIISLLSSPAYADIVVETKPIKIVDGTDGTTYLVNENSCTISDSVNKYKYSVTESENHYEVVITYPDGSTYWENGSGAGAALGWSDDYIAFNEDNEKNYPPGEVLCRVLRSESKTNNASKGKHAWTLIIALILGLFSLFLPEAAWYLHIGWKIKDAEPSDAALIMERVVGGIFIGLVILYFIV